MCTDFIILLSQELGSMILAKSLPTRDILYCSEFLRYFCTSRFLRPVHVVVSEFVFPVCAYPCTLIFHWYINIVVGGEKQQRSVIFWLPHSLKKKQNTKLWVQILAYVNGKNIFKSQRWRFYTTNFSSSKLKLYVWCTAKIWRGKVALIVCGSTFQETDFWNSEIWIYLYLKISCLKKAQGNNLRRG